MTKSRFTESQIVAIWKAADVGIPVNEVRRKHGISPATYFKWMANYGGLDISELKSTHELQPELSRLKRMRADLSLENRALKDLIAKRVVTLPAKREAVEYLTQERTMVGSPSL